MSQLDERIDRRTSLTERVGRRRRQLEEHRLAKFPLSIQRRFKDIEGPHLALVIAANAFVAIIPLLIIGYAFIEAFNPNRSIGNVLIGRFHLTGATADTVRETFTTAKAGKTVALSISLISLLITGLDIAGTVGTAYARAFRMTPLAGWRRYLPRLDLAGHAVGDDVGQLDDPLLGVDPAVVVPGAARAPCTRRDVHLLPGDAPARARPPLRMA